MRLVPVESTNFLSNAGNSERAWFFSDQALIWVAVMPMKFGA